MTIILISTLKLVNKYLSLPLPLPPIEKTWKGTVTLRNTSTAMAEVEFCPEMIEVRCVTTDGRRTLEDESVDLVLSGEPGGYSTSQLQVLESIALENSVINANLGAGVEVLGAGPIITDIGDIGDIGDGAGSASSKVGVEGSTSLHDEQSQSVDVGPSGSIERSVKSNNTNNTNNTSTTKVTTEVDLSKIQIEFDPPRILLMPEQDAAVEVHVTVFCLGEYDVCVPIRSTGGNGAAQVDKVHLRFHSEGPKVRFQEPEVDLGLVGVGSTTESTFTFKNEGSTAASFSFVNLNEQDMAKVTSAKTGENIPVGNGNGNDDEQSVGASLGDDDVGTNNGGGSEHVGSEASKAGFAIGASPGSGPGSGPSNVEGTVSGVGSSMFNLSKQSGFAGAGPEADVSISPASGEIGAGEVITATLTCKGGTRPQRVRGALRVSIGSTMQEVDPVPDQFVGYRCEVQAPKTIMYPMKIDVGDVYLGVPVYFDVNTENICNLPTSYTLERPGNANTGFKLAFDKSSGPLSAKEKVITRCEFTALVPGAIDGIIANRIKGVPDPLGFMITGTAKPPVVDIWPLPPPDQKDALSYMPIPIAKPTDRMYPQPEPEPEPEETQGSDSPVPVPIENGEKSNKNKNKNKPKKKKAIPPSPLPVVPMAFATTSPKTPGADKDNEESMSAESQTQLSKGSDVDLYERCSRQFAIRNLSAVPVRFDLNIGKYFVMGNVGVAQLAGVDDAPPPVKDETNDRKSRAASRTGTAISRAASSRAGTAKHEIVKKKEEHLLVPQEDGANKFHSEMGQTFAERGVQRRENRLFLTSGLGASYLVSVAGAAQRPPNYSHLKSVFGEDEEQSSSNQRAFINTADRSNTALLNEKTGYLPPWGVARVVIRTFNDMPGGYNDQLEVSFTDMLSLKWQKSISIPLKMTVSGCPMSIDKSTYGMTIEKMIVFKDPDAKEKDAKKKENEEGEMGEKAEPQDMLSFGCTPFNSDPVTRECVVCNNGSMPGKVSWRVRAVTGPVNGPIKLDLEVTGGEKGDNTGSATGSKPGSRNSSREGGSKSGSKSGSRASSRGGGSRGGSRPDTGKSVSDMAGDDKLDESLDHELMGEVKVKTVLNFWSDLAKGTPFKITPEDAVIPPYGRQKFTVTLTRTTGVPEDSGADSQDASMLHRDKDMEELAQLVGEVKFVSDSASTKSITNSSNQVGDKVEVIDSANTNPETQVPPTSLEGSVSQVGLQNSVSVASTLIPLASTANQSYRLRLLLNAKLVNPSITLDKKTLTATSAHTEVSMLEGGIKFKVSANQINGAAAQAALSKIVTIVNPTDSTLVCSISTQGQFAIKTGATTDSNNTDKTKRGGGAAGAGSRMMSQSMTLPGGGKVKTPYSSESLGRTVTLLPKASSSFALAFQPSRGMRSTINSTRPITDAAGSNDEDGKLVIAFSTGQKLFLPLLGNITTPFLAGSSPNLQFGVCRVGANCDGVLLLSNPTTVGARWTVKHVPQPNDTKNKRAKENAKVSIRVPGYVLYICLCLLS